MQHCSVCGVHNRAVFVLLFSASLLPLSFFRTIAAAADVVAGVVVVVVVEPEVEMHGHIECAARCTALL